MPDIENILKAVGPAPVRRAARRCIRLTGSDPCKRCIDACHAALDPATLQEDDPAWDRCTACGACAAECPTDALFVEAARWNQSLADVIAACRSATESARNSIDIACARVSDGGEDVSVCCFAAFDASLLARAWAQGVEEIRIIDAECSECPISPVERWPRRRVESLSALARDFGLQGRRATLVQRSQPTRDPQDGEQLDRRAFLGWLRERSVRLAASLAAERVLGLDQKADGDGAGERSPAPRRTLAIGTLRTLASHEPGPATAGPGPCSTSLPRVHEAACTLCGSCALFCPTGALRVIDDGDQRFLGLLPADCVGCGLCVTICPYQALAMSEPRRESVFAEPRILRADTTRTCTVCKQPFAANPDAPDEMCPICRAKAERFKGFY